MITTEESIVQLNVDGFILSVTLLSGYLINNPSEVTKINSELIFACREFLRVNNAEIEVPLMSNN